jgi:aminobutyraldehyde dehydrogenase
MSVDTAPSLGLTQDLTLLAPATRGHWIGEGIITKSLQSTTVTNPATGQTLCTLPSGTAAEVDRAVTAAARAFVSWRTHPVKERAAILHRVADLIDEHSESFARLEALNTGKPLEVARVEIPLASDTFRFFAGAARAMQTPAPGEYLAEHLSVLRREPVGVVGAITPWNYPLMMAAWKIAPALAAGNTMVLKPSELTPLTTIKLTELISSAAPTGVFNLILGTGSVVGEAMSAHPGIAMMAITGSTASGRAVTLSSADTVKRVHLELGGNAPVVVFDDADLDAVTNNLRTTSYWNSGQECGSAARVIVQESASKLLVDFLVARTETLVIGDPDEGEHIEIGPLISARQLERVQGYVDRAVAAGAIVRTGGFRLDRPGYFYAPTVLTHVEQDSEIVQEEVFGPVVTVQTFSDEADALQLANDVRQGLAASVWTRDGARGHRLSGALNFGTVWINSHLAITNEMPWGGFAASGYGNDLSALALEEYTRTKHVMTYLGS